ncbi:MAG TPA: hypothetical protein DCE23_03840 [Firmicutes bacterium]|nr:hypothetical protein [Bacillota bacterium]
MALEHEGTVTVNTSEFYGMSAEGIQNYISEIQTIVIQEACENLESGKDALHTALRTGWTGQAEVNFEKNFDNQITATVNALKSAEAALEAELYAIANSWIEQDKQMVEVSE